jgi:hypothetical protein
MLSQSISQIDPNRTYDPDYESGVRSSNLFGRAIEFSGSLIAAAWRDQSGEALNQAIKICARAQ